MMDRRAIGHIVAFDVDALAAAIDQFAEGISAAWLDAGGYARQPDAGRQLLFCAAGHVNRSYLARSTRMSDARTKLAEVLREAIVWLRRPDNDFAWSSWNDAEEAVSELSAHIATLDAGKLPPKLDLTVLFAPTGPIQEVSVSSGWGDEFRSLAERFDRALKRAYRWSLLAAVQFTHPAKRRAR